MSKRVDIKKNQYKSIVFPKQCPVCGLENPDSHLNLKTYLSLNQPLNEAIGTQWKLIVPVCETHKKNIIWGRWVSGLLFVLLLVIMSFIVMLLLPILAEQSWLVVALLLITLIALSIFIHAKIYSAPLLLEAFSYRLMITFRDDDLAEKFAVLNGIHELQTTFNQTIKIPESKYRQD